MFSLQRSALGKIAGPAAASRRWRAVAAASIGNALEWYDFVIYGYFATT